MLREKLMVLTLQRSLSSCRVALPALDLATPDPLDVNALLVEELWDQLDLFAAGMLESLLQDIRAT